jgi:hypothetical protein
MHDGIIKEYSMKMHNKLFKTCLTGIVLSVAGLANATTVTSGLELWLKADTLSTDTTTVSNWSDQSGNARDASTSSNAPTYIASNPVFCGRPTVSFNGSGNDTLSSAMSSDMNINGNNSRTIFLVFSPDNTNSSNMLGYGSNASDQLFDVASAEQKISGHFHSTWWFNGNETISLNKMAVGTVSYNGSSFKAYQHDSSFNGLTTTETRLLNTGDSHFFIGGGVYPNYNNFSGDIAEILVYSEALSDSDRTLVDNYLYNKYATDICTVPELKSHAAISGGSVNIAAGSTVNGDLAAQAAVVIGANAVVHNIYAGAAVTTGALSTVENIFSGAAAGIGANAFAQNIHAGAAITIGASSQVQAVYAGAAITLGAGASTNDVLTEDANSDDNAEAGDIHNAGNMAEVITLITDTQSALSDLAPSFANGPLLTTMGTRRLAPGVWEGSAVSIAASSTITFDANENGVGENHVWVINLSEALTVGASTHFEIMGLDDTDTATIIWNVGAALTMGAGTSFRGTAFVGGAVNAATSSVSCGHLYATGAISIGSIGVDSNGSPVTCESSDAVFTYLEALD